MSSPTNVEYDSDQTSAMNALIMRNKKYGTGQGGIVGFLIQKGIVKNEKIAIYLMLGVSVVALFLTSYIVHQTLKSPDVNPIVRNHVVK